MNDWIRERNDIYNSNIFCLISLVTLLYVITYIIRVHRVPVRSFHLPSPQRESNFVPFFLSLSTVERWRPFSRAFVTSPCRGHPLFWGPSPFFGRESGFVWGAYLVRGPKRELLLLVTYLRGATLPLPEVESSTGSPSPFPFPTTWCGWDPYDGHVESSQAHSWYTCLVP